MYVLDCMSVTALTFHAEISPLNAVPSRALVPNTTQMYAVQYGYVSFKK